MPLGRTADIGPIGLCVQEPKRLLHEGMCMGAQVACEGVHKCCQAHKCNDKDRAQTTVQLWVVFYFRNITLLFRCWQGFKATWAEMSEFNTPEAITTTVQLLHSNVVG